MYENKGHDDKMSGNLHGFDMKNAPIARPSTRIGRILGPKMRSLCDKSSRNGALTQKDVKNEGTSGDVYENKGQDDKMSGNLHGFYTEMRQLRDDRQ